MTNQTLINKPLTQSNKSNHIPVKSKSKPIAKRIAAQKLKPLFKIERVKRDVNKKSLRSVLKQQIESNSSIWDCSVASANTAFSSCNQHTYLSDSQLRSASASSSFFYNYTQSQDESARPQYYQNDTFMYMAKSHQPMYSKSIMNNLNQHNHSQNNTSYDPYVTQPPQQMINAQKKKLQLIQSQLQLGQIGANQVINGSPKCMETQKFNEKEAQIGSTSRAVAFQGIVRHGQEIHANLDNSSSSRSNGSNKITQTQKVQSSGSSGHSQKSSTKIEAKPDQNKNVIQSLKNTQPQQVFELETIKKLGEGLQATIYSARFLQDKQDFIQQKPIKCLKVFQEFMDSDQFSNAETEFKVSQILKGHPNIVQVDSFERNQPVIINGQKQTRDFLLLEYCQRGDLCDFLRSYIEYQDKIGQQFKGLLKNDLSLLRAFFTQLINALSSLHKAGYAHLDIKLDNILVSEKGHLKLCDFAFSTWANALISKKMGTENYMAPEIHYARQIPCIAQATDIFSLGTLFFMLTFGAPPFHSATPQDTYFKYLKLKPGNTEFFKFHPHTRVLYRDNQIPQSLQNLLITMMNPDPNMRIQNLDELLSYDFIKGSADDLPVFSLEEAGNEMKKRYDLVNNI